MFWRKKEKIKKDLIEILLDRSGEYEKRSQAALDISSRKESKFLDPLIDALYNDPEPSVRMNAAFALGELGMQSAKKPLMHALKEDGSEWVRGFAASALVNLDIEFSDVENLMIECLENEVDAGARRHFAHSLGQIGTTKSGPVLVSTLGQDSDAGVRADAVEALGLLGYQEAYDIIVSTSKNDSSADVRRQAMLVRSKFDFKSLAR